MGTRYAIASCWILTALSAPQFDHGGTLAAGRLRTMGSTEGLQIEKCSWNGMIVFALGVITGTVMTVVVKVLYEVEAVGLDGVRQPFEKPLTTTLVMTLAMACALPMHWVQQRFFCAPEKRCEPFAWRIYFLLAVPACFDTLGTILAKIGLLYTTVSIFQLVRASLLIFTALAKWWIGDHITKYMWAGIALNTAAMLLVSSTTFFMPASLANRSGRSPLVGVLWVLGSCALQGIQYVFEEKVMRVEGPPPLLVVGMEGIWGTILMVIVLSIAYVLPGPDHGSVENVFDAWIMLQHSELCRAMLLAFFFCVGGYNVFCVTVTYFLSSIWHSILDNFRPVSVWATDLLIYYVISHGVYGEPWFAYSYLQVVGMLVLFLGTAVYSGTLRVPAWRREGLYDELDASKDDDSGTGENTGAALATSPFLASPSLAAARLRGSPSPSPMQRRQKQRQQQSGYGSLNSDANPLNPLNQAQPISHDRQQRNRSASGGQSSELSQRLLVREPSHQGEVV